MAIYAHVYICSGCVVITLITVVSLGKGLRIKHVICASSVTYELSICPCAIDFSVCNWKTPEGHLGFVNTEITSQCIQAELVWPLVQC